MSAGFFRWSVGMVLAQVEKKLQNRENGWEWYNLLTRKTAVLIISAVFLVEFFEAAAYNE